MAHKRFTDIDIWKKSWFRKLDPSEKCAWNYIKDNCSCIGIFEPDLELANFMIGIDIDWGELLKKLNGNIEILNNGKWFILEFCSFQYGNLSDKCIPHKKYIAELKKYGLFQRVCKGFVKGSARLQEKEKDQDKEEEKEKHGEFVKLKKSEYNKLLKDYGKEQVNIIIDKLNNAKGSKGYKYKSDYRAILNWVIESVGVKKIVNEVDIYCPACKTVVNKAESFCGKCGLDRTEFKEYIKCRK